MERLVSIMSKRPEQLIFTQSTRYFLLKSYQVRRFRYHNESHTKQRLLALLILEIAVVGRLHNIILNLKCRKYEQGRVEHCVRESRVVCSTPRLERY